MRNNKKILLIITIAIALLIIPNVFVLNNGFSIDNNNSATITVQNSSALAFWVYITEGAVDSSPALGDVDGDGKLEVIVGSDDGKIYALNGEDGTKLWSYTIGGGIFSSPALGDIDGDGKLEVVVGSDESHFVYALNGESGSLLWKYDAIGYVPSSPALADVDGDGKLEVVFGTTYLGRIIALNGENGVELWRYTTDYVIDSSPAIGDIDEDGNLEVVMASNDGKLYAINGENGSLCWSCELEWYTTSSPALGDVDGDGKLEVIIGTDWGHTGVYAINGEDGSQAWNYTIGDKVSSSPAIGDIDGDGMAEVVVGSHDGKVYAINGEDGSETWNYTTGNRVLSSPSLGDVDGDGKLEVVIGSDDYCLYALNGENGTVAWSFCTNNTIQSSPVLGDLDGDGKLEVVVGSADRAIYAYQPTPSGENIVWQGLAGKDFLRTKAEDTTDPIITDAPSDFSVEYGYTGVSISWTATDLHPNTYTIELQGSGIVAGPTAWSSGVTIIYNVPDGLAVGDYIYIVNFTDVDGNFITDSVTMTVEDTTNPIITDAPSDFSVEYGYTGVSISWTATDPHPQTYTIELQGSGIVAGPTAWSSGVAIIYNVPDLLAVGDYIYIVNFTDVDGNFITDSVTMTVEDTTNPIITDAPSDFSVEYGYTGVNISWTATDLHPNTYTIELQGSGIVAGPTAWSSGVAIIYNVPDGLAVGDYIYIVNFTDVDGNFITDSVTMTVEDKTNPIITDAPNDFSVEYGYTGVSISWTATDLHPNTYTIELQGSGIVAGPTAWSSGVAIIYNVPDGLAVGEYIYTINFTDVDGNFITDSVTITVEDTTDPIITDAPSDFSVEYGYTGITISWTATDPHPHTYTIELQGSGIVADPTAWSSGVAIMYNIPDGLAVGDYIYTVNFTDQYGNSVIHTVTLTVRDVSTGGDAIPLGLIIISSTIGGGVVIGIAVVLLIRRRRKLT